MFFSIVSLKLNCSICTTATCLSFFIINANYTFNGMPVLLSLHDHYCVHVNSYCRSHCIANYSIKKEEKNFNLILFPFHLFHLVRNDDRCDECIFSMKLQPFYLSFRHIDPQFVFKIPILNLSITYVIVKIQYRKCVSASFSISKIIYHKTRFVIVQGVPKVNSAEHNQNQNSKKKFINRMQ